MICTASLDDEQAIRELCTSVHKDDYVLYLIHNWLLKESVSIYERDHRIVGMLHLAASRDNTAHLGAMRVHPDFRRQGIARELTLHCIEKTPLHTIRLATVDNPISQALAEKLGFTQIATFAFLYMGAPPQVQSSLIPLPGKDALPLLKEKHPFVKNRSLLCTSFTFYEPTPSNTSTLISFIHNEHLALIDLEVEESPPNAFQIAYCDPDPELINAIFCEGSKRKVKEIWALTPKNEQTVSTLTSSGFTFDADVNVLERTK